MQYIIYECFVQFHFGKKCFKVLILWPILQTLFIQQIGHGLEHLNVCTAKQISLASADNHVCFFDSRWDAIFVGHFHLKAVRANRIILTVASGNLKQWLQWRCTVLIGAWNRMTDKMQKTKDDRQDAEDETNHKESSGKRIWKVAKRIYSRVNLVNDERFTCNKRMKRIDGGVDGQNERRQNIFVFTKIAWEEENCVGYLNKLKADDRKAHTVI